MSVSYDVIEFFMVFFEGINIIDEELMCCGCLLEYFV